MNFSSVIINTKAVMKLIKLKIKMEFKIDISKYQWVKALCKKLTEFDKSNIDEYRFTNLIIQLIQILSKY